MASGRQHRAFIGPRFSRLMALWIQIRRVFTHNFFILPRRSCSARPSVHAYLLQCRGIISGRRTGIELVRSIRFFTSGIITHVLYRDISTPFVHLIIIQRRIYMLTQLMRELIRGTAFELRDSFLGVSPSYANKN